MAHLRAAILALLCLVLPAWAAAADAVPLPALRARVTDLTGTLDAAQRGQLEAQLARVEQEGRAQIAVLLLPTTRPESIEQFGIRLAEAWKIGRQGKDDGLIVIVAKNDRKMRIEVGYGLEGSLPDAVAKRIISEIMAPRFKQGDFYGGLAAAVAAIDRQLGGSAARVPEAPTQPPPQPEAEMDGGALLAFLVLLGLALLLVKSFPWLPWPAFAAYLAGTLSYNLLFSWLPAATVETAYRYATLIGWGIGLLVFLLVAYWIPKNIRYDSGGGGSGGGSSSYDSGGSDFGGGGGDFGGGGASGDW